MEGIKVPRPIIANELLYSVLSRCIPGVVNENPTPRTAIGPQPWQREWWCGRFYFFFLFEDTSKKFSLSLSEKNLMHSVMLEEIDLNFHVFLMYLIRSKR